MKKLIIWLIRKKLGLKKEERFRFSNQKSTLSYYYFTDKELMKVHFNNDIVFKSVVCRPSTVSLNFLLSDEIKVVRLGHEAD